jgi:hypothetical protein
MWQFEEPTNLTNLVSIVMGIGAGLLFVFAKTTPVTALSECKSGDMGYHNGQKQVSQVPLPETSTKPMAPLEPLQGAAYWGK